MQGPREVYRCVERFKGGRTSILDGERSERPSNGTRAEVTEEINQRIRDY